MKRRRCVLEEFDAPFTVRCAARDDEALDRIGRRVDRFLPARDHSEAISDWPFICEPSNPTTFAADAKTAA